MEGLVGLSSVELLNPELPSKFYPSPSFSPKLMHMKGNDFLIFSLWCQCNAYIVKIVLNAAGADTCLKPTLMHLRSWRVFWPSLSCWTLPLQPSWTQASTLKVTVTILLMPHNYSFSLHHILVFLFCVQNQMDCKFRISRSTCIV